MRWDLLMGESKKTDVIKCDLRPKCNRRETRTIHIRILYLYSVETDFNEQEWHPLSPIT